MRLSFGIIQPFLLPSATKPSTSTTWTICREPTPPLPPSTESWKKRLRGLSPPSIWTMAKWKRPMKATISLVSSLPKTSLWLAISLICWATASWVVSRRSSSPPISAITIPSAWAWIWVSTTMTQTESGLSPQWQRTSVGNSRHTMRNMTRCR